MNIFKKIVAKLTGMESGPPKPKESGVENFNRNFGSEQARLAEERRQANLRRAAEQGRGKETDVTEELKGFESKGKPN